MEVSEAAAVAVAVAEAAVASVVAVVVAEAAVASVAAAETSRMVRPILSSVRGAHQAPSSASLARARSL